jgi:poly-gamma-glutamate synthesis protein (capsule biosynthesis protein)
LAAYERQVSHAAIDAGADLVLGHHAHILKGIELYQGKAIFHGLCNFVTYLPFLAPRLDEDPHSWASRRRKLFGFEPDPEYPTYPFHPEAIFTIIGRCIVKERQIADIRFIPCLINKEGHPKITGRDAQGQKVFDYMEKITREAGLSVSFEWKGNEVGVCGE